MIADCERALGRPERAIDLARGAEAKRLTAAERVELAIVEAGARRDLGQLDAARLILEDADLARGAMREWSTRLWYAYADILLALGRKDEAAEWFRSVVAVDEEGDTDAEDRLSELEGGRRAGEER